MKDNTAVVWVSRKREEETVSAYHANKLMTKPDAAGVAAIRAPNG